MQLGILTDAEGETPPIYTTTSPTLKNYWELKKGFHVVTPQQERVCTGGEWINRVALDSDPVTSFFLVYEDMRSSLRSYTCLIFDEAILVIVRKICTKRPHGSFWQRRKAIAGQIAILLFFITGQSHPIFLTCLKASHEPNMGCKVTKKGSWIISLGSLLRLFTVETRSN